MLFAWGTGWECGEQVLLTSVRAERVLMLGKSKVGAQRYFWGAKGDDWETTSDVSTPLRPLMVSIDR